MKKGKSQRWTVRLEIRDPELGILKVVRRTLYGEGRNTIKSCGYVPSVKMFEPQDPEKIMLREMKMRLHLDGTEPHIFSWQMTVGVGQQFIFTITLSPSVMPNVREGTYIMEETPGGLVRIDYNWVKERRTT